MGEDEGRYEGCERLDLLLQALKMGAGTSQGVQVPLESGSGSQLTVSKEMENSVLQPQGTKICQ